ARHIESGLATERRALLARISAAASALVLLAPLGWLAFSVLGARAAEPHVALLAECGRTCAGLALLAAPLALAALVAWRRGRATAAVATALAATGVALIAATPLEGGVARWKSAAPLAAAITERLHEGERPRVLGFMTYPRGLAYYLGAPVALALSS